MRIITVINAKGGCGKSTIAMNVATALAGDGHRTLLIDLDPQAQVTAWIGAGDGIHAEGTIIGPIAGMQPLAAVIQHTHTPNLWFVASAQPLEDLGRQITEEEGYHLRLTHALGEVFERFDFCVIDSPNQISPVMENAIYPTDLFVVPFESTKAVKSYANVYGLIQNIRGGEPPLMMYVLSNLSRLEGLRKRVLHLLAADGLTPAKTEIRTCGWLAQVDEHGGSIFGYRPNSNGARDILALKDEILLTLGLQPSQPSLTKAGETQLSATV